MLSSWGLKKALPIQAALLEHGVGPLGGLKGGLVSVLADEDGGGAVDVEVRKS